VSLVFRHSGSHSQTEQRAFLRQCLLDALLNFVKPGRVDSDVQTAVEKPASRRLPITPATASQTVRASKEHELPGPMKL
jgi:hypothetical protein